MNPTLYWKLLCSPWPEETQSPIITALPGLHLAWLIALSGAVLRASVIEEAVKVGEGVERLGEEREGHLES